MRYLKKFENILTQIEIKLVILLLSLMIIFSFGQVILRNLFNSGIFWADIFLRQLVLWVGFIGASLATRERKHISIDFLPHFLPSTWGKPIRIIVDTSAAVISGLLAYAAWKFVQFEMEGGSKLFLDLPVWIFQTILPASFCLITLRFLINVLEEIFPDNPTGQ